MRFAKNVMEQVLVLASPIIMEILTPSVDLNVLRTQIAIGQKPVSIKNAVILVLEFVGIKHYVML